MQDRFQQEAIDVYLATYRADALQHSTLELALRDARGAALRDPADGTPQHPDHSTSWLGTIGYLVLLDQLGETLRPSAEPPDRYERKYPTVRRCLERFAPELSEPDTAALYGLRCALAHDYGLWNPPPPNGPAELWHCLFTLISDDTTPFIRHPPKQWDGRLPVGRFDLGMTTVVNVRKLANRVEALVGHVREMGSNGRVEIALDNPADLNLRFGIRYVSM
jgi:hypothetical protein